MVFRVALIALVALTACTKNKKVDDSENAATQVELKPYESVPLPEGLKWITNDSDPVYADPNAKKGGVFRDALASFPLTLRVVGPDSNHGYRSHILSNFMSLITLHPNTENILPELATHWAYGDDKKTMYYKINPKAVWSDGKPVLADDFVFTLEFYRSKNIVAPWYNNHFTEVVDKVTKHDDRTVSVTVTSAKPDLHLYANISAFPRHYYNGTVPEDFVKRYNWEIVPNNGPYIISNIRKGKSYDLVRKKDWWAQDLKYFKNRFNVDKIQYKVIRDVDKQFQYFLKGELDNLVIVYPQYWHDKTAGGDFAKGYIKKLWFYNNMPRGAYGFFLNADNPILKDVNVRKGIAHAMNVDKVSKTLLRGDYERLAQHYTGYGDYTNNSIVARPFDLKKADEYFSKAGWGKRGPDGIRVKDGKKLAFEVSYGAKHVSDRLAIIKEEAKKAGLELNLKIMDGSTAFKYTLEKKHEIALMAWSVGLRPVYWQHYHSDNAHKTQTNNISNLDDKELDKLIKQYRDSIDEAERLKLSHVIQEKLHEASVFVPTWNVPYFREAYWRWWRLPKVPATKTSNTAFDPLDSSSGGLFWYDEQAYKETQTAMKSGKTFKDNVEIVKKFKVQAGS